jgi:hypothetical protein
MPSSVYQNIASLNVILWELRTFDIFLDVAEFTILTPLSFQSVPCDSVSRNKVSIRHSPFFYFSSLTTCLLFLFVFRSCVRATDPLY